MDKVNFNYAFGAPHRITLSRPSASEKTIFDLQNNLVKISWGWGNLKDKFPLSWQTVPMDIFLDLKILIDGKPAEFAEWRRTASGTPMLAINGDGYIIEAIAVECGCLIKLSATRDLCVVLTHTNGWVISNQGWIDGENTNVLMTMNHERADRLIAVGSGADCYSLPTEAGYSKSMLSCFKVEPGQTKNGFIFMPYKDYFENIDKILAYDFENLFNQAKNEWDEYLNKGIEFIIPDESVLHCYKSCLADLFVMREELADGYTGVCCGTEHYRSVNSGEPALAAMFFDKAGYTEESLSDMRVYFDGQNEDGCWACNKGWERDSWGVAYNKSLLALEHYKLTRDTDFLREIYKRMKRSSLWNHAARQRNKIDVTSPYYGLLPRGMGDCGLMNGCDYYGVFYPGNFMVVAADGLTLDAAKILGEADVDLLEEIYLTAKADLIKSVRNNSKKDNGIEYIPGIAGADNSSLFGCLFAYYPAGLLDKDDPLICGAVQLFETRRKSEGGLPIGTGWMKEGLWVAMALDNLASAYLRMGEYDKASAYLYPVLNHASPFVTWCEERGAEIDTPAKGGDMQHLWTPAAVCQFMRDMMIMERKDCLHIACATPRHWLSEGQKIGVKNASSHYGKLDFVIGNTPYDTVLIKLSAERKIETPVEFHIRLPLENYSFEVASAECEVNIAGESVTMKSGARELEIVLNVVKQTK
ncbi:MAG: hypothetical protein FWF15_00605 [Oscillospiraceae bacterium]|nr:hypothetical protein [Oscillospiraceae bacterium]